MDRELFEKRKKLICELIQDDLYVPMKEKELAAFMQVSKADREEFRKVLDALLAEGKIQLSAKGKYSKPDERLLTGTFIGNDLFRTMLQYFAYDGFLPFAALSGQQFHLYFVHMKCIVDHGFRDIQVFFPAFYLYEAEPSGISDKSTRQETFIGFTILALCAKLYFPDPGAYQ